MNPKQTSVASIAAGIGASLCCVGPLVPITLGTGGAEKVAGVKSVKVDFGKKRVPVSYDDAQTSVEQLAQATKHAGYPAKVQPK